MPSIPTILNRGERRDGSKYWHFFGLPGASATYESLDFEGTLRGKPRYDGLLPSTYWLKETFTAGITRTSTVIDPDEAGGTLTRIVNAASGSLTRTYSLVTQSWSGWTGTLSVTNTLYYEEVEPSETGGPITTPPADGFYNQFGAIETVRGETTKDFEATGYTRGNLEVTFSGSQGYTLTDQDLPEDAIARSDHPEGQAGDQTTSQWPPQSGSTVQRNSVKYGFLMSSLFADKSYVLYWTIQRRLLPDGEWEDFSDEEETFTASARIDSHGADLTEEGELEDLTLELPYEKDEAYRVEKIGIEATSPI